jgi:hypothetical protein
MIGAVAATESHLRFPRLLTAAGVTPARAVGLAAHRGDGKEEEEEQRALGNGYLAVSQNGQFSGSPWSQLTRECQRFGHPPRLNHQPC